MTERDTRITLLNSLLTIPHRQLDALAPLHREICQRDPRFYVHLAAWYFDKGDVRDHKELFVVHLALSSFPGHRDVGLALLRRLPPYEVARVVDFIKGRTVKVPPPPPEKPVVKKVKKKSKSEPVAPAAPLEPTERKVGLFVNVPRSLRTEVERYLREREADPKWLDNTILHARKALKRLYAVLHIRPGPRAQAILFDEEPPADSVLHALREVSRCTDPAVQAEAIRRHQLPYRVAASVIHTMTPAVVRALVEVMTPQELINNLGSLKERGALADPEVAALVEAQLDAARRDERVSAFKTQVAAEAASLSGAIAEKLEQVAEDRIKARGRITRPTALLIDKSSSMHEALEVGRQVGAMISALCARELFTYVFDRQAYAVQVADTSLAGWENALAGCYAGGATSIGSAIAALTQNQQWVEQLVLITDENENAEPWFSDALNAYREKLNARPSVILVKVGQASDQIESACRKVGITPAAFPFTGDYYALPNLVPLLTQPSLMDLLTPAVSESFGRLARGTGGEYFPASQGEAAVTRVQEILQREFGHLDFDRELLKLRSAEPQLGLDVLAERLNSSRPAVAAALSRLGARELL